MIAVLNESGLGDDFRVIRFMDRVGKLLDAEKTGGVEAKPSAHGSERTPRSPEAALRRIREIQGDVTGPFRRKEHPQHAELVEHVRRLYKTAYPD
jgi:hypothetical protein